MNLGREMHARGRIFESGKERATPLIVTCSCTLELACRRRSQGNFPPKVSSGAESRSGMSVMEVLHPLSPRRKKETDAKETKEKGDHSHVKKEVSQDTLNRKGNEKESLKGDADAVEADTPEIQYEPLSAFCAPMCSSRAGTVGTTPLAAA